MALDISGATVGYDADGIASLLAKIKADVIDEASTEMKARSTDLENALDQVWQGDSEEQFKENMQNDIRKVRRALDKAYESLASEIGQIGQRMGQVDENLVESN